MIVGLRTYVRMYVRTYMCTVELLDVFATLLFDCTLYVCVSVCLLLHYICMYVYVCMYVRKCIGQAVW